MTSLGSATKVQSGIIPEPAADEVGDAVSQADFSSFHRDQILFAGDAAIARAKSI
jgi:hypothetical protein